MRRELIVADDWVGAALEVIRAGRPRTWALAGGSTPRALYQRLGELDLLWGEVECFLGDERCVPADDPASNYGMAAPYLEALGARVHSVPASCDAAAYEELLRARLGPTPAFDVALLGLGADAHTASLFPGDAALEERVRLVARVERPDFARLTLTLPVLSASKLALFLVTGVEKREALRALLEGGPGAPQPAARVRAQRVVVVADRAAAG